MNMMGLHANLICFTGSKERAFKAKKELKRVGLFDTELHWSFPNPFDKLILNGIPHTRMFDENIGFFNCSRMHYRIIKCAYEYGDDGVFICEDDCRFRKDIDFLVNVVGSAPVDSDVLLLDAIPPKKGIESPIRDVGNGWAEFDSMRSGACYILSRKAMKRILWLYESVLNESIANRKARICDQWFDRKMLGNMKLVMAHPNVAVQQTTTGTHNSGNDWRLNGYKTLGINLNDYAEY